MSLDDNGTGNLLDLVLDIFTTSFSDLFDETTNIQDDVKDIMFRWAGVDGVSAGDRGEFVDARELGFLEKMMGQDFLQRGIYSDPFISAGLDLQEAFHIAFENVYARLLAQSAGGELFTGDFHYDIAGDEFTGITGLDSSKLSDLETEATNLSTTTEKEVFWGNVVRMIEFAVGTTNLPGADQTALDDAITASDASLDLQDILDSIAFSGTTGSLFDGDSGDNTLTGGSSHDELNGYAGDDTLTGEAGADFMRGGSGDDTYNYDLGDGIDTIIEKAAGAGNFDEIVFGSGIDSGDLSFTRAGLTDLVIDIDTGAQTGQIIIENHFNYAAGGGHVEQITFDDMSTYDLDGQNWTTTGTDGDDTLRGVYDGYGGLGTDTIYGGAGDDIIRGNAANESDSKDDTLYGEAGNDELYGDGGADTLYGGTGDDELYGENGDDELHAGTGNDYLEGGAGSDDYHYTSGHMTVKGSNNDTLYLDAAWDSVTPDYFKIGNDLQVLFDEDNTITIKNMFSTNEMTDMIYDDTTTVDLTSVSYVTQGTSGNDSLSGTGGDDVLYGYAGDDTITGGGTYGDGDDSLYGGTGDDDLDGGRDDDYLDGGAGDDYMAGDGGNDTFYYVSGLDEVFDTGGTDVLEIDGSWEYGDITMYRNDSDPNDLIIDFGTGSVNSITITGMFYSGRQVETLRMNDGTGDINLTAIDYETRGTASGETIVGITNGNVNGGDTNDTIYGYAGNDTLEGRDGNDTLYGGDDDDTLEGGDGNDVLYGGAGDDELRGQRDDDLYVYESGLDEIYENYNGNDTLWITGGIVIDDISIADTGTNETTITINSGVDEIYINNQESSTKYHVENLKFDDGFETDQLPDYDSWMWGTTGNDISAGNANDNVMIGDAGDDDIDAGGGNDDVHGGAGTDDIHGDGGDDFIHGGTGADTLYGDAGDDLVLGGAGDDTLYGGDGYDLFYGEAGDDTYDGGNDIDTLDYSAGTSSVTVDLSAGSATDSSGGTDTISNVERIIGSSHNDTLTGDAKANTLIGGAGDDYLSAGGTGSASTPTLSSLVLYNAPVAYWRLNETSGTTADNEGSIGSSVDGTYENGVSLGNTALYSGGGYSADFDGTDDYVSVPDNGSINKMNVYARTIELAFSADSTSGRQVLYEEGGSNNSLAIYIDSGSIYFNAYNSGDWGSFTISDTISTGTTYHAALVLDEAGDEVRGYLDGSLVGTGTIDSYLPSHSQNIGIGAMDDAAAFHDGTQSGDDYYFDGQMSDVAIYNEVLSDSTIAENASVVTESYVAADTLDGGAGDDTLESGDGADNMDGGTGTDTVTYENDTAGVTVNLTTGAATDGGSNSDTLSNIENVKGSDYADTITGDSGANLLEGNDGNDTLYGEDGLDTLWGGNGDDTFSFDSSTAYNDVDVISDFNSTDDAIDISDLLSAYDPMTDALTDFVQITDNGTDSTLSVDADGGANDFTAVASILGVTGLTDESALETSGALITS